MARVDGVLPGHLGKFEILGHIATGGMAEIHLARALGIEGFEKIVVLKRILPQLTADPEFVRMFLDEARIAATLQHSNIVQVHDIGVVGGNYFFAMEFLDGEDLSRIMKALQGAKRELPLEHAVHIVSGVCAGLHYAHEKTDSNGQPLGIVHRDASPQNVFVTFDGGIKLVDFGIAKAAGRASKTRYGTLKGKVRYMSPEQGLSLPLDRRSDVFSVAVMLWEVTTGQRLHRSVSEFEILKQIIEADAPPPSSVKPDYPPELERIVMKGLHRNRDERYPTTQDMQADLEEFAREHKLAVSAISLSRFMRELFRDKLDALHAAQRGGTLLNAQLARAKADADQAPWLEEDDVEMVETLTRTETSVPPARSTPLNEAETQITPSIRPTRVGVRAGFWTRRRLAACAGVIVGAAAAIWILASSRSKVAPPAAPAVSAPRIDPPTAPALAVDAEAARVSAPEPVPPPAVGAPVPAKAKPPAKHKRTGVSHAPVHKIESRPEEKPKPPPAPPEAPKPPQRAKPDPDAPL